MGRDINKSMFDDATKLKLNIFGECFEEWFPVFLNSYWCKKLYIFDFFAGSGKDLDNNQGSPLVLLNRAKGASQKYCDKVKKEVSFLFNENRQEKSIELEQNVASHIKQCQQDNNCDCCVYQYRISSSNFQDIFSDTFIRDIFNNRNYAKFVLLDQYGFSQIDEQVFQKLVSFPRTDFIFFISSSFISRFREHPNTKKYIDTSKINFSELRPNEIHRGVANYFRDLISTKTEYYLHHFSIQKEVNRGNYYGLIFGTGHSLGMEKFLKVCWKEDPFSGEANYNIDCNFEKKSLFGMLGENVKKDTIAEEIRRLILSGEIADNVTGLKYALHKGCKPKLFTEIVKKLEEDNLVERYGDLTNKNKSTDIHRVKVYQIRRLSYGT